MRISSGSVVVEFIVEPATDGQVREYAWNNDVSIWHF